MSFDSARSLRCSSCVAFFSCSSSRSAAFSSNSSEARTCAIERAWSLSVLAPSSFQNRLPTRPEVRVFVFATRATVRGRRGGSAAPRSLASGRLKSMRTESPTGFEADPLVDGVGCRVGQVGEQHHVVDTVASRQARCRGGHRRAVTASTRTARREDGPDARHTGRGRAQHRHAHRRAVVFPENEPVAHGVGVVDEPLACGVISSDG